MNKSKNISLPEDRQNVKELTITILGNANSGKSTLTGILTNPLLQNYIDENYDINIPKELLDNGNGKSRKSVLQYTHEQKTGRTSSITYNYMLLEQGYKIISFVDLAGHESYLKTTITGITSSYPDFAFICVEKNITNITKEHLGVVHSLGIPFAFLMTKIDIIPETKLKENLKSINKLLKSINKKVLIVKNNEDLNLCKLPQNIWVPVILISNTTGFGMNKLIKQIGLIQKRCDKLIPNAFAVDNIYNVSGFGLIVSGLNGINIKKNDELFIGPFSSIRENNGFISTKVRSIHDDYRNFVDILYPGQRGCLSIKIDGSIRKKIRTGLVLVKNIKDANPVKTFKADIHIFHGHSTTIKPGYSVYINSGIIKSSVKFNTIYDDSNNEMGCIRSGNNSIVDIEFLKNKYCVVQGEKFIFREGNTRGVGIIL
jgi:elongation factor 1-alpha